MLSKHPPSRPSELAVQASAYEGYKAWLGNKSREKGLLILAGRAGIGKQTMSRVLNKMFNYKEIVVDALLRREEAASLLESASASFRTRDIKNRRVLLVVKDIEGDPHLIKKVADFAAKGAGIPVVVILEEVVGKDLGDLARQGVLIRCFRDKARVTRRVKQICSREGIPYTPKVAEAIEEEEGIGRVLNRLALIKAGTDVPKVKSFHAKKESRAEILRKIFYAPALKKRRLLEIEQLLSENTPSAVLALLFANYAKKCFSLKNAEIVSEANARFEGAERHMYSRGSFFRELSALTAVCVYRYHLLFGNDLFVEFDLPQGASVLKGVSRGGFVLYDGVPIASPAFHKHVLPVVDALRANSPRGIPDLLLRASLLERFLSADQIKALEGAASRIPEERERAEVRPRYIYKEGHSCYVVKDVCLDDLLR